MGSFYIIKILFKIKTFLLYYAHETHWFGRNWDSKDHHMA